MAEPKKNGTKLGKFNLIPLLRCRIRILQCFFGLISQRSYSFFRVICVVTFTHGASPTTTPLRRRRGARFEEGPDWKGLSFAIISLSHIYIYYTIHILYHSYIILSYLTPIVICHILYHFYLNMILFCSKKTISICLHLYFCSPWRSIWYLFVSSPPLMEGTPKSPIFPTALRHWTIHRHPPFEVIGPKSRLNGPQRSAVLPGVLVAWLVASPIFVERGRDGKHKGKNSVFMCFLCMAENSSAKNFDGIFCWK